MSTRKHTTTTVRTTEQQSVMEPVDLDDFLRSVNLDMAVYQRRLDTFKGNWKYENDKDAICTAEKVSPLTHNQYLVMICSKQKVGPRRLLLHRRGSRFRRRPLLCVPT